MRTTKQQTKSRISDAQGVEEIGGNGSLKHVVIAAPRIRTASFQIVGTSPYVQHAFGGKAQEQMRSRQMEGQVRGRKKHGPKDFAAAYEDAKHVSDEGWYGIPAASIRNALISACRLAGYPMTRAKLSLFVVADGYDSKSMDPLIKIESGAEPERFEATVRLADGTPDIHVRPLWRTWWAKVVLRYDEDQFSIEDVANLLCRAGIQVGIGEGRNDSKKSNGMGWGCFEAKDWEEA